MRLGATNSEICVAATAKRRSPSRNRTNDCEVDSMGGIIPEVPSPRQQVRRAVIREAATRRAAQIRRRSRIPRDLRLVSHFDRERSIRDTTPALRCNKPTEELANESW